jgi:hypothetical protein
VSDNCDEWQAAGAYVKAPQIGPAAKCCEGAEWSTIMKKLGLIVAAIVAGGVSLSAPSFAQDRTHHARAQEKAQDMRQWYGQRLSTEESPYHQDRLPDRTITGPLSSDNPNG